WEGWAILLRQKQKKLIMLPSETMIWQPEFTDKTLSRKPGAVQVVNALIDKGKDGYDQIQQKMNKQASLNKRVQAQLGTLSNL
ncbi:hypothetical protein WH387_23920, partial [Salmonella enterica subsp. enterica]|uniref:hypothetical protein n=1 Tax=Salmonella enterica TaxID=28901 RepID=UPI0030B09DD3